MKKCTNCSSKNFETTDDINVCLGCNKVYSQMPVLNTFKKLYAIKEKNKLIAAYNDEMEQLQKRRTAENIERRKRKDSEL